MTEAAIRQIQLALLGFLAVLALAWFCYQPAISGGFQLDDHHNLGGLTKIVDTRSAVDFIFSGTAGPTGRPLALSSFALQADSWERGAAAFLEVNILIHLLNAALLALVLYQLALQRAVDRTDAAIVAAAAASLWVLMPLLASASLLVVQRMTTLSAVFMLLGLSGYLFARATLNDRPGRALAGMSASLVAGTVLATLCKESGLLLPVLALVLEATVLERPTGVKARHWRSWQMIFLVLPLTLLLAYLASRWTYPDWRVLSRDFDAWERLLSEGRILWIYLSKALLGIPGQLGIYQDVPTISRSLFSPVTFLACFAWLSLLLASIVWRRRYPLFALAVLWYLAGHLIESTVVPLELYFEHRNYMPIIGPLFALCSFLFLYSAPLCRAAGILVPVLAFVSAGFLYSFSSLSGDPSSAARYWASRYPGSPRAVAELAEYQYGEDGPLRSLQTIDMFVGAHPEYAYMRIPELYLLCQVAPEMDHRPFVEQVERELPNAGFTYTAGTMLFELFNIAVNSNCKGIDAGTVASLAIILRGNPRYASNPLYGRYHHKLLAGIARQQGNHDATIDHLQQAIRHWPSSDLNSKMVMALADAGQFDAARNFVDDAETRGPVHPVKAVMWRRDLDRLRAYILKLEQDVRSQPRGQAALGRDTGQL